MDFFKLSSTIKPAVTATEHISKPSMEEQEMIVEIVKPARLEQVKLSSLDIQHVIDRIT